MKRHLVASAAIAMASLGSSAHAQSLSVMPIRGVYGLNPSSCFPGDGLVTAKIAPEFCGQLEEPARLQLGAHFAQRVGAAFPGAVASLGGQIAAGETPEGRLSKTVIATLHISRVDLWRVEKPAAYDVFVPLTLSLYLTNALTGEVMFVENYSTVVHGTLGRETYLAQAQAQLPGQLTTAVDTLITRAAARFKPYAVSGKVLARIGDRYVLDVGRSGGVREGDMIGEDAKVVFSDAAYSIVEPQLGKLEVGQTLSRQVAQPIEMLEKPSALVVVVYAPPELSKGYITATFEEALGQGAGLAITPSNPSATAIRALALSEARLSSNMEASRALPEYFIRLSVASLEPLEFATNVAGTRRRVFEARAFIQVIDRSGRVVFATQGVNRIKEDVSGGIAFSAEQRRDTVLKNALTEAAAQLARGFRPAQLRLEARPSGSEIEILDPGGALGMNANAVLLRKTSSSVGGVSVWAPIGKIKVNTVGAASVKAVSQEVEPLKVRAGDQIAFESGGGAVESRKRFSPCIAADGKLSVSQRGAVSQPLYAQIATNSFAAGFRGPVYLQSFPAEAAMWVAGFPNIDELGALKTEQADVCFEPIHQVSLQGETTAGAFVTQEYSVALGYTLRRGSERLAASGLQSTLKATGVPVGSDAETRMRSLQLDLADEATKLTGEVARALRPPQ